jgi:DNA-binding transcriptional LysR family regulator
VKLDRLDLNDLVAFVRVVDAGGYAAAERKLGVPRSSLSRRVARLEDALSVRLLRRTSRTFAITDGGQALYERAVRSLALLREATESVARAAEEPRGVIRLGAPPGVGVDLLPPLLTSFCRRYAEVTVLVEFVIPTVDLVAAGFDLAMVPGPLRDSALARRKLQEMAFKLYAAPSYLQRAPAVRTIQDLSRQACVLFATRRARSRWRLHSSRGVAEAEVRGALVSDDIGFVRRAICEGAGVGLLPEVVGERLVDAGLVERVLPDYASPRHPLFLVYAKTQPLPVRVERLRDHLVAGFEDSLRAASVLG